MTEPSPTKKSSSLDRFAPVLVVAIVAMAFAIGALWQKVQNLEGGSNVAGTAKASPAAAAPAAPTSGKLAAGAINSIPEVTKDDHVRGNRDAKVKLIEYSDYYCPFCTRFHPTAQQMLEEYGDEVAWVYRHFPLDTLHPNARPVAEIAECLASTAGEDAFWKFTDAVYTNNPATTDAALDLAATFGASKAVLESCFNDGKFKDLVDTQYKGGVDAGITGTPGNLIINADGDVWKLPGAVPFESLTPVIDEALGN